MADWHNSKEWREARAYAKTILDPTCVSCGKHLEGNDWTIDHIVAAGSNGIPNHDLSNLQSMCRYCNGKKQDRSLERTTWFSPKWASGGRM